MTRREILDGFLRDRAVEYGAVPVNGLVQNIELPAAEGAPYTVKYSRYDGKSKGTPSSAEFDIIVGADGANSRTAKAIDAGQYNFAIAFQERIKIPHYRYITVTLPLHNRSRSASRSHRRRWSTTR